MKLQRRDLAIHLDCPFGRGQRVIELGITLEPFDGVRQQPAKPAGKLQFRLRHVSNARFEVFAARVHRSDHRLISKNEFQVDAIGGHFNLLITSRDARQD